MECPIQRFALVIPTLNEAANVAIVLQRAAAALSQTDLRWEILVVDDQSCDGTDEKVKLYAESDSRIRLLTRRAKKGLAGAITYAWNQTDADWLGVMDADLQHPPELLPALLEELRNGVDIVIASRYLRSDSMDGWNPIRKAISLAGVLASKPVQRSSLKVKDPLSGFFVLRRECIAGLEFQPTGFKLLLEILARGRIQSAAEVPFKFDTRHSGTSKANAMTAVHYIALLYKLSRNIITGTRNTA